MNNLDKYRKKINNCFAERSLLKKQLTQKLNVFEKFNARHNNAIKARAILQMVAKQTQDGLRDHFSKLVSMALESVFGENAYEFIVKFEEKRGKTEGKLLFKRGDYYFNPLSCGFGYVDIACFALQIAFLITTSNRRIMFLDEPFKNLRGHLYKQVGQMLKYMSNKLDLQFIVVTHLDDMLKYGDNIIDVTKKDEISCIENITYEEFLKRKAEREERE